MVHSNQEILTNFIGAICRVVSEGTSDTYATMVMTKFNKSTSAVFPFVKYIHLSSNKVQIDKEIDSVDAKLLGKFIKKMIDSLFSDLFKRLIKRELGVGFLDDINNMGVKI